MTTNETIDGLQEIIDRNQKTILPRVHIGYLIHAVKYLKEQKEEIENLKQTAQSMMEGICLLKEHEAIKPIPPTDELDLWKCGNCNHQLFKCTHQRYCENCGRAVKWE